jgi:outer membrane protein assembly factor BamB
MKHTAILLLMLATISASASDDWPRFRGPNGAGVSDATTVPTEWTEDDYNWIADLPGEGHGSPVVVGNRIFLLCGNQYTAERSVVCINSEDGQIVWSKPFKSAPHYVHRDNNYASSTPAADDEGVVVTWTTPKTFILLAVDNDGEEVWQRDLGEYKASWGGAPSPIIVDGMVIVLNDQMDPKVQAAFLPEGTPITDPGKSYAIALDRATGETRWKVERKTIVAGYATPCVRELDSGKKEIVFFGTGNGMTGIDASTGAINWEVNDALRSRTVMSPVLAGDLIVGSAGGRTIGDFLVALRPPNSKDDKAEIVFKITQSIPLVPTVVYKDGLLFMTCENGTESCVSATTGDYLWRERIRGRFLASPVLVDGRLFCVGRRGDVFVLSASETFEELAHNSLGDDSFATPAVANGSIYFRTATQLISIGGEK